MTGALVAAGLLLAVVAFALAFASSRGMASGAGAAALTCLTMVELVPTQLFQWAFAGCWVSLILTALLVYFPMPQRRFAWVGPLLGVNGGVWAGTVIATEASLADSLPVVLVLLLCVPARLMVGRGWSLALRIVTSWLLAVALLVGSIPLLVVHPGYVPDHKE
jgi:hypothetical protein